jgi:hypothetical protein
MPRYLVKTRGFFLASHTKFHMHPLAHMPRHGATLGGVEVFESLNDAAIFILTDIIRQT